MNSISVDASKFVFVAMALTACTAFMMGRLEAKDFMYLVGMAFSFFFGITQNATSKNASAPTEGQN